MTLTAEGHLHLRDREGTLGQVAAKDLDYYILSAPTGGENGPAHCPHLEAGEEGGLESAGVHCAQPLALPHLTVPSTDTKVKDILFWGGCDSTVGRHLPHTWPSQFRLPASHRVPGAPPEVIPKELWYYSIIIPLSFHLWYITKL